MAPSATRRSTSISRGLSVVFGVARLAGFSPNANALESLATIGVLAMFAFALTWLTVALGLVSKSVETASNLPMVLVLLPFLGSGFVPTGSMPAGLRWFAEYQPFTPINESLRGLLLETHIGTDVIASIAWCAGITLLSSLWAKRLYIRRAGDNAKLTSADPLHHVVSGPRHARGHDDDRRARFRLPARQLDLPPAQAA